MLLSDVRSCETQGRFVSVRIPRIRFTATRSSARTFSAIAHRTSKLQASRRRSVFARLGERQSEVEAGDMLWKSKVRIAEENSSEIRTNRLIRPRIRETRRHPCEGGIAMRITYRLPCPSKGKSKEIYHSKFAAWDGADISRSRTTLEV
jgi:hypothetical protein